MSLDEALREYIPVDHARQVHVRDELIAFLKSAPPSLKLLDLGCGDGRALAVVREFGKSVDYCGIDIEDSSEVRSRTVEDPLLTTYDGINIPFPDDHFDLVYSCSVFEHVRHIEPLLLEVSRILKPGGLLLGSVSFLEPYHSRSLFNFTPYGLVTALGDNGFSVRSVRPGIDGLTLTMRYFGLTRLTRRYFHSPSPFNRLVDLAAKIRRKPVFWRNAVKLRITGHVVFEAEKRV